MSIKSEIEREFLRNGTARNGPGFAARRAQAASKLSHGNPLKAGRVATSPASDPAALHPPASARPPSSLNPVLLEAFQEAERCDRIRSAWACLGWGGLILLALLAAIFA